jgi:methionine-rich copper-binding protein CopC
MSARKLAIALGLLFLLFSISDWLKPRPHYASSMPEPGATVPAPPSAVIVRFTERLDASSSITVESASDLRSPAGTTYSDRNVATASGVDRADPKQRSLRADLRSDLPSGVYRARWNAVAARGKGWRWGTFYFGVARPAPAHAFGSRGGPMYERDGGLYFTRTRVTHESLLAGGLLLIALGLLPRRPGGARAA